MESFGNGVDSSSKTQNSTSVGNNPPATSVDPCRSQPPSVKQPANGSASNEKHSYKMEHDPMQYKELPDMAKYFYSPHNDKSKFVGSSEVPNQSAEKVSMVRAKSFIKNPVDDPDFSNSSGSLESESIVSSSCGGDVRMLSNNKAYQSAISFCSSPSNSVYTATLYAEAKQSFTNTEVSEEASCIEKPGESGDVSNAYDVESRKTSVYRGSTDSDVSDERSSGSLTSASYKPHKANDIRWEAIQAVQSREGALGLNHFKLLRQLGCGDIGNVYLSELTGTRTYFAMKVMQKATLTARKKLPRAQTEREILQSLDHPFLPTLYAHFETEKFSCLVMEFCPGGDLHALRQRQPGKCFPEHAARLVSVAFCSVSYQVQEYGNIVLLVLIFHFFFQILGKEKYLRS